MRPRPHRTRGPRISSSTCTRRKASRAGPARSRVPRAALVTLVLLAGACAAPQPSAASPTPSPTREPGTYAVTALLDLSGTRGPRGDAQRNAMQQWADAQRGTPRIRLRITDVGGSDAKLLVELKRAADAGDADAFVVGVPATIDDALSSAIALVKRPVLFTLPIAEPGGDGARWIFGLAPAPEALAEAVRTVLADRDRYAAAARRRAVERFAVEPWLDRHGEVFDDALRGVEPRARSSRSG